MKYLIKHFRRAFREKALGLFGLPSRRLVEGLAQEQMYFTAFLEIAKNWDFQRPFFPFRGAASSGLLYLVARGLYEFDFNNILELGCGQTTILLDEINQKKKINQIHTYENSPEWAARLQRQVSHNIIVSPLTEQKVAARPCQFYSDIAHSKGERYDLLIVDGPYRSPRYSRLGSLKFIEDHLQNEFLIIFDDAERLGEKDTYHTALKLLKNKGIKVYTRLVEAKKSQFIIATEKYRAATHW